MRVFTGVFAILLLVFPCLAEKTQAKQSAPFAYSGYSATDYTSHTSRSAYVPMSDGAKLAVDVFLPADGPSSEKFPVVLEYLPYQRARINPQTGKMREAANSREGHFYLSHGYAIVLADMRGTGASTGWMMDFMPQLKQDGRELIEWIAVQPWCDGNVGMKGSSYLGWSQLATASQAPAALKCMVPQCVPLDGYTGEAYPGGIFLQGFFDSFSPYMHLITQNFFVPDEGILPTKPVVDEDGDGDLADEIPIDKNGNGTFLDDGFPPAYPDGQTREHIYYRATQEHMKNLDYAEWASKEPFLDSPSPLDVTLSDLSPSAFVPGIMAFKVPIYHVGGWYDAFARGTCELYATMAGTNPSKLVMSPSYHDFTSGPMWKHFGINDPEAQYLTEHLRFFDHYLKGIDNGIDREPPVTLFVMNGGGWRQENEWPLARQVMTPLHFDAGNRLASQRSADGNDTYKANLTHDSSYTESKGNRYVGIAMQQPAAAADRAGKAAQCLVYTGNTLDRDTEVTGHPITHLFMSSTSPDADVFVYLEDVTPDGAALLVTEGQLRAGFAALHDNDTMINNGRDKVDVVPELPWHGFKKSQYNPAIFANDAVVELALDLNPTSWVFKQGHRIRLSIACADFPTFRLHPAIAPANDPNAPGVVPPIITLYRSAERNSRVELPVIPYSTGTPK
ncbi:MAG TPA: CocE/NonD family hydrolase [Candidatus Bathyarchaeia archaeon]|nr:CocE/NonD family hydrolase [Candidatus Bathyarchaeia archaeon]